MTPQDRLIVALDAPLTQAEDLVRRLEGRVRRFKIGLRLFTESGPHAVEAIQRLGGEVFLDLKFYDIPNTVRQASAMSASVGVWMLSLHASGGEEMLRAAREGALEGSARAGVAAPKVVGVTVLTSVAGQATERVAGLAKDCHRAGLDGVVCAAQEIEVVREVCGAKFLTVVPGIRLESVSGKGRIDSDDQKRVSTPREAVARGADFIVVGRPVLASPDPLVVVDLILKQLS